MRNFRGGSKSKKETPGTVSGLKAGLHKRIVGQPAALEAIVPHIQIHQAGLSPEGRPAGVFLLLGPTGTGKTKTVEALAEVLHGSERNLLRIDCAEFQLDHEVAKLIGAPPGYLGHRETHPLLTQAKLNSVVSERSPLSIVLFDEIEKAAPSLTRLLLGVLDKATLRLGDNTAVNFERSLIFLTSNLGARDMARELSPGFGFDAMAGSRPALSGKLESVAMRAVRKHFSPEFVNRLDTVVTYQPLDEKSLSEILDLQLAGLQQHIHSRRGCETFYLHVAASGRKFLLNAGTSPEYGARELKRAIQRHLITPLAELIELGIEPGATVIADAPKNSTRLHFRMPAIRLAALDAA